MFPVNNNKRWEEAQGPSLAQHVLQWSWKGKPITQRALQGQGPGGAARIHTRRAKPWGPGERSGGSADIHCGGKGVPPRACSLLPHLFPDRSWQVLAQGRATLDRLFAPPARGDLK